MGGTGTSADKLAEVSLAAVREDLLARDRAEEEPAGACEQLPAPEGLEVHGWPPSYFLTLTSIFITDLWYVQMKAYVPGTLNFFLNVAPTE